MQSVHPMEDNGKYLRLFGTLFFSFIGFIAAFVLLMLGIRLVFGMLVYIPWVSYVYLAFILIVPAALFVSGFIIYFRRTRTHPSKTMRGISYFIFSAALLIWGYVFISDMIVFFKHGYQAIEKYKSYEMIFLAANVACFFLVGIMQAFTTEKEKDWMERSV